MVLGTTGRCVGKSGDERDKIKPRLKVPRPPSPPLHFLIRIVTKVLKWMRRKEVWAVPILALRPGGYLPRETRWFNVV